MKNPVLGWLKAFMWFVCLYHVTVGLALNLNLGLKEWVATIFYGATVDWKDAQFVYILKPLGAFMIALGFMAAVAARDPLGRLGIVYGFALLFTLRALQRVVFMADSQAAFSIAPARALSTMGFMLLLAAALVVLSRTAAASSTRGVGPARA
jgi:hypothetical protein